MKTITVIGLLCVAFAATSCNDSPVVPQKISVTGQVGYDFGYVENAIVDIDGHSVTTDEYGNFSFSDVEVPYDLRVLSSNKLEALIFKDVNTPNPFINFDPDYIPTFTEYTGSIIVELDTLPKTNQKVFSIFVPDQGQPKAVSFYNGGVNGDIRTDFKWHGINTISGKILVIYYTVLAGRIQSFDKYFEKTGLTVTSSLHPDTIYIPFPYTITANTRVSGNIHSDISSSDIKMKFTFKNSYTNLYLDAVSGAHTYSFPVPESLPEPFNVKITASNIHGYGTRTMHPGAYDQHIKIYRPVNLIKPEQYDSVKLFETIFSWETGEFSGGIYSLEAGSYSSSNIRIKLYTTSISAVIPDLLSLGVTYPSAGTNYNWGVKKYYGVFDMDSFLSSNFNTNPGYQGYSNLLTKSFIIR